MTDPGNTAVNMNLKRGKAYSGSWFPGGYSVTGLLGGHQPTARQNGGRRRVWKKEVVHLIVAR